MTSVRHVLICSLPVLINLFPWSSFPQTFEQFKYGYIFPINNLNSKLCLFKYPSHIHTSSKDSIEWEFCLFALKWLPCICTVWCFKNLDGLRTSGGKMILFSYKFTCIYSYTQNTDCSSKYYSWLFESKIDSVLHEVRFAR